MLSTTTLWLLVVPVAAAAALCQEPAQPASRQAPSPSQAGQGPSAARPGASFSTADLEQIAAPIALYPDALLTQVMMAATYPLEVVEASRWVQKNLTVKGDKLEAALKNETWDPSVKSLCGFPDLLERMSDNLDWTQDLGDAFLGQQAELMDAVQAMRRKAFDAGTLKSSKEITVVEQADKIIVIQQADPEVVYVPAYYPSAVYGGWGYPYWRYPALYPVAPAGGVWFGFTVGVIWGGAMWGGCHWGWGHTDVDINVNRQNNFIDRTEIDGLRQHVKDRANTNGKWQHDATHRKGVGYRNPKVAQQYDGRGSMTGVSRDQARGYRPTAGQLPAGDRTAGDRAAAARQGNLPQATPRTASPRSVSSVNTGYSSGSFSGSRNANFERASSARGSASRGTTGARGGRGGGGRGR